MAFPHWGRNYQWKTDDQTEMGHDLIDSGIDMVIGHGAHMMQEVERYSFRMPGQATSYFCGYEHLMALRTDVEMMLGPNFDRSAYHDFILSQGLLPPNLLRKAVMEEFVPQYKKAS